MMHLRRLLAVGAILALGLTTAALAGGGPPPPLRRHPIRAGLATVPKGLPGHVFIGLRAGTAAGTLQGWMPSTRVPWDSAWTYLPATPLDSTSGWKGWSSRGTFPLNYATVAHGYGYLPAFTLYEQTPGGRGPALASLQSPMTMAAYYADVRLLMQRLGTGTYNGIAGYGKTAIVQVEPDLAGFAEQSGAASPASVPASVASSGDPDASGFPNTFQGYNWALLHLRDLYAPNVIMAATVSPWATGINVSSDTRGTLNRYQVGQTAGRFILLTGFAGSTPLGVSPYQLVFEDPADHDAGTGQVPWWDALNVLYPNFHGWEDYLRGIHDTTGAPVIPWQVPVGNQSFLAENNTRGHYQDNRASYIFTHMSELASAGVAGIMFGQGTPNSLYYDGTHDGTTNPPSVCTMHGLSHGQICTHLRAVVSDDDGGNLRLLGTAYYANPVALTTVAGRS